MARSLTMVPVTGTSCSNGWPLRSRVKRIVWLKAPKGLSLKHISEPTRRTPISYPVFSLKKKPTPTKKTHSKTTQTTHFYNRHHKQQTQTTHQRQPFRSA